MIVVRKLKWHPEMEDIMQDAMLKLFEKRNRIPVGKSRKSYVCSLVRNVVNDFLRKQYRNPLAEMHRVEKVKPQHGEVIERSYEGFYTPEHLDPWLIASADRVVAEMLPKYQQVLVLQADGFDTNEIAEKLNLPAGTVRSRLHYAKKEGAAKLSQMMR